MDEEVQQTPQEVFDDIILGLALIGLLGGIIAWAVDGFASPWFLRSIALIIIVLVAFILRRMGQFVIAAYVLVLELLGVVAGMFFEVNPITGFIPYLFIPVIIIASLILTPNAVIAITLLAIALALAIVFTTGQFTPTNLLALLPSFGLSLLTAFLASLGGSYLRKLDRRLAESSTLLRERTLELLKFMEKVKELQSDIANLEQQLAQTQTEVGQTRRAAAQKDQRLFGLVQEMLLELKGSVNKLERVVETVAEIPQLDAQPNLLNEAWQKLDHLTRLVISMEDLIRLENDELQLEVQTVDVAQLLRELVEVMRGLAREKHLDLRASLSPDIPLLEADPTRLRQALLHVLSNAIKYTNQGMIEVQTELTERELLIFVSDTGMGMPTEMAKALFQESVRENKNSGRVQYGPGLGLTITKRLIELHGGRIWVTSMPGVGSTFSIALPLQATRMDLLAPMLSAKPLPTDVATLKPEAEPATSAVEETMLSATPLRASQTPSVSLASSGNNQTSIQGPGQRNRQTKTWLTPPATPSTPKTSTFQTTLPPVARFSSVYISRFSYTLIGILLTIIAIVAVLAWVNGPNQRKATPTRLAQTFSSPVATGTLILKETIKPEPTRITAAVAPSTPTPRPTPTASPTSIPTPTESVIPVATKLPEQPKNIPEEEASPTSTPTQVIATPTETPVSIVLATPAVASLEPRSTAPETPSEVQLPTSTAVPIPTFSRPDLSFGINSSGKPSISLLSFNEATGIGLAAITAEAANSGLSWQAGQALFSAEVNGDQDLFLGSANGNPPLNLTQSEGDDLQPAWSPDGRQIAFSSGRNGNLDIYILNRDCVLQPGGCKSELVQLTTSRGFDEWPAWSPDGRRIAFVSDRDGNVEIYLLDSQGGNQQRLTHHPADDWPAAWSPDGRHLVFASNRDGHWNLYLIEANGGEPTRLTNDPGDEREPVWSPDGRTIAFAYRSSIDNWDIYTLPAPTGAISEIPRSAWTQVALTASDEHYPIWLER